MGSLSQRPEREIFWSSRIGELLSRFNSQSKSLADPEPGWARLDESGLADRRGLVGELITNLDCQASGAGQSDGEGENWISPGP